MCLYVCVCVERRDRLMTGAMGWLVGVWMDFGQCEMRRNGDLEWSERRREQGEGHKKQS